MHTLRNGCRREGEEEEGLHVSVPHIPAMWRIPVEDTSAGMLGMPLGGTWHRVMNTFSILKMLGLAQVLDSLALSCRFDMLKTSRIRGLWLE